ncbi:MAG: MmcQ/YjbR family DNA-binding protein [Clostridia bacterium]|nr:MmcQ/YjbR family DNA-binding protein [Clostridia bacterium]
MTRKDLLIHVADTYGITPDFPFEGDFTTAVCRHRDNRKWFAILMEIPSSRLGLGGDGTLDVVNLKISPEMLPALLQERGIFPAYHMSKTHWVTAVLDGTADGVSDEMAVFLTEVSFALTRKRGK